MSLVKTALKRAPLSGELIRRWVDARDRTTGEIPYLEVLRSLHETRKPSFYLEIGVRHGNSLRLASCDALGVDPAPDIHGDLPGNAKIEKLTSDEFFAREPKLSPIDLALIDGMHRFEYALRDFINIERRAASDGLIVFDDVFPNSRIQATRRVSKPRVWSGDVWKVVAVLRDLRPDLRIDLLDASPAGLAVVWNLNPSDTTLKDGYRSAVRRYRFARLKGALMKRDGAQSPSEWLQRLS